MFFPVYICKPQTSVNNYSLLCIAPTLNNFHKACIIWLLPTSYVSFHGIYVLTLLQPKWFFQFLDALSYFIPQERYFLSCCSSYSSVSYTWKAIQRSLHHLPFSSMILVFALHVFKASFLPGAQPGFHIEIDISAYSTTRSFTESWEMW